MMQSLAGEVNTAISPRHHGYAMCFTLSSCRSQLAIWFPNWRTFGSPITFVFANDSARLGRTSSPQGCAVSLGPERVRTACHR